MMGGRRRRGGGGGGGGGGMEVVGLPGWLEGLVGEESGGFFVGCGSHESRKKNEKNIFCLCCCISICNHCVVDHPSHPLLQVRRYVYNDVVRLHDLEKLIDCSYVQPYTINSAKVVFLKARPQSRPFRGSGNICLSCDRILQEPFHFCSLSCKVDHVVLRNEDLSSILFRFDVSDFTFTTHFESLPMVDGGGGCSVDLLEEGQITPDSILEDPLQYRGSSSRGNSGGGGGGGGGVVEVEEGVKRKKKKKGRGFFPQLVLSLSNRRKGAPHRSPLS